MGNNQEIVANSYVIKDAKTHKVLAGFDHIETARKVLRQHKNAYIHYVEPVDAPIIFKVEPAFHGNFCVVNCVTDEEATHNSFPTHERAQSLADRFNAEHIKRFY